MVSGVARAAAGAEGNGADGVPGAVVGCDGSFVATLGLDAVTSVGTLRSGGDGSPGRGTR